MDLKTALATQGYVSTRPATQPKPGPGGAEAGATSTFAKVAENLEQTIRHGEATALDAMTGKADPHALVQALAQTELAVETAVTVRNKVVEAYQEILRMPI